MPIPENRSTLFYGIGITIARGTIHLNHEDVEFSLHLDPDAIDQLWIGPI